MTPSFSTILLKRLIAFSSGSVSSTLTNAINYLTSSARRPKNTQRDYYTQSSFVTTLPPTKMFFSQTSLNFNPSFSEYHNTFPRPSHGSLTDIPHSGYNFFNNNESDVT